MEFDQNLSAIKLEPIEIKSEAEDKLLVGITGQSIAGGQEFEDAMGPISGSGLVKTEPTEIKSEPEDASLLVKIAGQDVAGGQKFKEESDNDLQTQRRPKEPKIQADNQSVLHALDDNKGLVMKYTLGEGQSESESVDLSNLYKSKKGTTIEEKDEPEFIKLPSSKVSPTTSKESVSKLRRHIRDSHRERTKLYKCPFCPFTSKHGVSRHIISKHKGDNDIEYFVCHTCGHKSKFKKSLVIHMKTHRTREELMQTNEIYKCEQCPKTFRYKASLLRHTKYHHNKNNNKPRNKLQCDHCVYRCRSRQNLKYHIQKKHTPVAQLKTLMCFECDFTTKFVADLNKHKYRCHRPSYQCPKCPYRTHNRETLDNHERTHKIHKCIKCDYQTYRLSSLQNHSVTHLKPEEIQYFYCYHCNFKAKWRSYLKVHIKRHFEREQVEFECHICDFKTKKRQKYSRHIGEHKMKLKL